MDNSTRNGTHNPVRDTENGSSGGKRTHARAVIIVVIVIAALAALAGLRVFDRYLNPEVETTDDTINVTVAEVALGDIEVTSVHTGKITAEDEVNVVPKIPGKALSVKVELGDKVNKGDTLFVIDPSDVETQDEQARIQRDAASKARSSASGAVNDAKKARKDAEKVVKDIDKQIKEAKKAVREAEKIGPAGAAALAQAQAVLQQLEQSKAQAEAGVAQAKAGVKQAQSAYDQADAQYRIADVGAGAAGDAIKDTEVTAPISGYVTGVTVQKGGMVSQAMPAVVITSTDRIQAATTVAENLVDKINVGDSVEVYVRAVSDEPYRGVVRQIVPAPPTGQTTYPVIIDFENISEGLKPGMLVEAVMVTGRSEGACLIPSDSVMIRDGKEIVATLGEGDKVEIKEVTTGIDDGENIEIVSGVSPGERVVTEGQHYIDEDSKIRIVE
ncbi:MAG: efflux RND transporter periplasmic adaptor subunit [Clostridiales Family XIII bacterium]|jgi:RND family efflux transporter MFP subunit|nr:efflux RND transporter periplasmic adaptor subunit [Clostridiales Family XIII bacterium]